MGFWAVAGILFVSGGIILCMAYVDPQSSRFAYIFQAYYTRTYHAGGFIEPPEQFTGTWRTWYKSGFRKQVIQYTAGKRDGQFIWYFDDCDRILLLFNYRNGLQHGPQIKYDVDA